jgi:uncharacterized Fe-S cluster-containing radical SAM superfamily protein
MRERIAETPPTLDPAKFRDPDVTADGHKRAAVALRRLETLWINTGTLCNLACENCYIESSPVNDRLAHLTTAEVTTYLEEALEAGLGTEEIAFTGGEPFMNPGIIDMLEAALERGFATLVLTNAMRPMMKRAEALAALGARYPGRTILRVSLDHYTPTLHELLRGPHSWRPTIEGIGWLIARGFTVHVAGRTCWRESEDQLRAGYGRLFATLGLDIDAGDTTRLTLFPEMDVRLDVPEITERCWGILGVEPGAMMCATSRMVLKRKGAAAPVVVPCTLLPDDPSFEFGRTLGEAARDVKLNHPHCARFCVLGGGSCGHGD